MKKIYLSLLTLATFAFAACSDSESIADAPNVTNGNTAENAISFSTYMGNSVQTRAGATGAIGTDTLKGYKYDKTKNKPIWTEANALNYGFGVFAYYTGTKGYGDYDWFSGGTVEKAAANFMFNQQVWWSDGLSDDYITKWTYSPVKYWPNEVGGADAPDDDQNNNTNSDPATGSGDYGGNLTFFAYAPYVTLPISATSNGITAINGKTALADANSQTTEPTLTYIVAERGDQVVDLLWGTKGNTSVNVLNANQPGVASTAAEVEHGEAVSATAKSYADNILKGYTTNANLTKQMTTGKVDFAFKHALAKVGGSTITTTTSTGSDVKNGLMVILDIDDMKGAEVGGDKDASTKVTVKEIKIVAKTLVKNGDPTKTPADDGYQPAYMKTLQGDFNLATGKWTYYKGDADANLDKGTSGDPITYPGAKSTTNIITQNGIKDKNNGTENVTGRLADKIKEPIEAVDEWSDVPAGVLTTAQNVYANEAFPLVFIPGTYPELTITIDYLVRTKDDNLSSSASGDEGSWTKVEQVITKKLTFTKPVELNKQYSILMHLGLTGVKFTASVSDWEVVTDDPNNFDSDEDGTNDIKVEDVYLPINVAGLMVKYANDNKADSKATSIAKNGDYTYYVLNEKKTADVSKLALDDTYSGASWITGVNTTDGSLTLEANTTYADREGTVKVKFVDGETKQYSDIITILQRGRKPTFAEITWTPLATIGNIAKAGNDGFTYPITKLEVKGADMHADGTTDAAFSEVIAGGNYELVFIDDATGEKATWIDLSSEPGKIKVSANPYNTDRSAKLFIKLESSSGKNYNKLIRGDAPSGGSQIQLIQKG